MSGLWAVLSCTDAPVDPALCAALTQAMAHRGNRPPTTWAADGIALGHIALATTPEAEHEQLPLVDPRSGTALVWDGRLDNRAELHRRLGLTGSERNAPDAELVLAAYLRFGDRFLHELIGDWALVLWDPTRRILRAARDPTGWRQLFHTVTASTVVVASEAQQLLAAGAASDRIDLEHVRRHLDVRLAEPHRTEWADIRRLPPGDQITFAADRPDPDPRPTTWWTFPHRPLDRRRDAASYQEEFDAVLLDAVRARTRATGRVGLLLSGGIDSSALAGPVRDHADTIALTSYAPDGPDERAHARPVARRLGIDHVEVDISDCWTYSSAYLGAHHFDQVLVPVTAALVKRQAEAAAEEGITVLIDGNGGDDYLDGDWRALGDAVLRGRPDQAWRIATVRRKGGLGTARAIAASTVRAAAPPSIRALLHPLQRDRQLPQSILCAPSSGPRLAEMDLWSLRSRHDRIEAELRLRRLPPMPATSWYDRHAWAATGVEARSPLHDVRVVAVALNAPDWVKAHTGYPRALLRQFGKRWLDDGPMDRIGKTWFDPLVTAGLERETIRIERALRALTDVVAVDAARLAQLRAHVAAHPSSHETTALLHAVSAGSFLGGA